MTKSSTKAESRFLIFTVLVTVGVTWQINTLAKQENPEPDSLTDDSLIPLYFTLLRQLGRNVVLNLRSNNSGLSCILIISNGRTPRSDPEPISLRDRYANTLRPVFNFSDSNGDGELSKHEFKIVVVDKSFPLPFEVDSDERKTDSHRSQMDTVLVQLKQHVETAKTHRLYIRKNCLAADVDSNNTVSLEELVDYIKFVNDVCAAHSAEISTHNVVDFNDPQAYKTKLRFYWIRADLDRDEELSKSEFQVVLPITGVYYEPWERERFKEKYAEQIPTYFNMSGGKSGRESLATYCKPYETAKAFNERVNNRFKFADADSNGSVSLDEMAAYYVSFNQSFDPPENTSNDPSNVQLTKSKGY